MEINLTILGLLKIHQWLPITYGTRLKSLPWATWPCTLWALLIPPAKDKRFLLLPQVPVFRFLQGLALSCYMVFHKLFSYPRTQLRPHETKTHHLFPQLKDSSSRQPSPDFHCQ